MAYLTSFILTTVKGIRCSWCAGGINGWKDRRNGVVSLRGAK